LNYHWWRWRSLNWGRRWGSLSWRWTVDSLILIVLHFTASLLILGLGIGSDFDLAHVLL
jgi:hypothetical protein